MCDSRSVMFNNDFVYRIVFDIMKSIILKYILQIKNISRFLVSYIQHPFFVYQNIHLEFSAWAHTNSNGYCVPINRF